MGISPMGNVGRFPQGTPAATKSRYPTLINYKVHAGSFRVSIIHRTLTWTTGSLTCVRDHYYVCVCTLGLGTPTASQHNVFDSEKLTVFVCAPDGIRTSVIWILSPTLCQLSHPVTRYWCSRHTRSTVLLPGGARIEPRTNADKITSQWIVVSSVWSFHRSDIRQHWPT